MNDKVYIFDSTLRDGSQAQGISFSVKDKLQITKKLDELGVSYIEAGNPGSNPKDAEFFEKIKDIKLKNSKLCAFGSTRKANIKVHEDSNLKALINSGVDVVCIFGKAWDFHVTKIIKTTLLENLAMIKETIEYLKVLNKEVIFDAEHFFDGYKNNPQYTLMVLEVARNAGADWIVLCDTNGGTLPNAIKPIIDILLVKGFNNLGIHCHNDSGVAVANSLIAVEAGVRQVQGTFTGLGERCGNANLSTIIGNLMLKMNYDVLPKESLIKLVANYRYICEVSNIIPNDREAYVGSCAFAHKGGMHIDAVRKNPISFEHINPIEVGNARTQLMSEVAGRSTIMSIINKVDSTITKNSEATTRIMKRLKELEHMGYQFEGAEGSFELLVIKELGLFTPSFELVEYRVMIDEPIRTDRSSTVTMKIKVNGVMEVTAADGNGPVNALDKALRKALSVFYPSTLPMYLTDYKVRVIGGDKATSAKVRVLIESTDGFNTWTTVGVSHDIIEASWKALVDSVEYKLLQDSRRD
ncbi:citramalate synthase [Clostridium lacusfryxellense]|uniref:citramalate synthase n=1 Tax=Clostridium lacusfryxellense TaxID=205328 RepID=UPI001FEB76FB